MKPTKKRVLRVGSGATGLPDQYEVGESCLCHSGRFELAPGHSVINSEPRPEYKIVLQRNSIQALINRDLNGCFDNQFFVCELNSWRQEHDCTAGVGIDLAGYSRLFAMDDVALQYAVQKGVRVGS